MPKRCRKTNKQSYANELEAKIALSRRASKGRDEIRAYLCNFCPNWHLTSQPQRVSRDSSDH